MSARKSAHILVMDDVVATVAAAIGYLAVDGYQVSHVFTAAEAKAAIDRGGVDLAILDVDLLTSEQIAIEKARRRSLGQEEYVEQEGAGYLVAAWARRHHPNVGIIMYSSQKTDTASQLKGIREGADDFLIKGDDFSVFKERVESVLRRRRFVLGAYVIFDECELDLTRKEVRTPDNTVPLTDAEFRLLEALIMSPRRSLPKERLYAEAFRTQMPNDYDRAIDTLVAKLRRKLGSIGGTSKIQTIRGVGYRLECNVSYKW